jgi:hypothetical protein
LGKKGPAVCIECEHSWVPEPILKAKQTYAAPKPVVEEVKKPVEEATADGAEKTDAAEDGDAAAIKDPEVEVKDGGDEKETGVAGDISLDDEKADVSGMVDTKLEQGGGD